MPTFRIRVFNFVLLACGAFVLFSALAMLTYPGGFKAAPHSAGYSFTGNFFSDLGRHRAINGADNSRASFLFDLALGLAGVGLMVFFASFAGILGGGLLRRVLALWGGAVGILSGACFIGVGVYPLDVNGYMHGTCVIWAFRFFFLAVVIFAFAINGEKNYPQIGAWIFVAFGGFLLAYLQLLSFGPSSGTPAGLVIQVTGQKLIVYFSVLCVALQAILARGFLQRKALLKNDSASLI